MDALLITFGVSAFWHDIYISYYIGSLHWGILLYLSELIYRKRKIFDLGLG